MTLTLQGHPEEVYAAHFLQAGSSGHMLTASEWTPFLWDVERCQQLAAGDFLPKEKSSEGETMHPPPPPPFSEHRSSKDLAVAPKQFRYKLIC